jgi:hypothetical protein
MRQLTIVNVTARRQPRADSTVMNKQYMTFLYDNSGSREVIRHGPHKGQKMGNKLRSIDVHYPRTP